MKKQFINTIFACSATMLLCACNTSNGGGSSSSSSSSSLEQLLTNKGSTLIDYDKKDGDYNMDIYAYYPSADDEAVKWMSEAGITGAIATSPTTSGTSSVGSSFATTCAKYGIKDFPFIINSISNDSALATSWFQSSSATKGIYLYDEPFPSNMDDLSNRVTYFNEHLSDKLFLTCLMDPGATASSRWTPGVTYKDYLNSYKEKVFDKLSSSSKKTLLTDTYPLTCDTLGNYLISSNHLLGLSYWAQMNYDIPDLDTNVIIMCTDCVNWYVPSIWDLRFQTNALWCFGMDQYSLFTYDTPASSPQETFRKGMIQNGAKTEIYDTVKQLNSENHFFDGIYHQFEWDGVTSLYPETAPKDSANSNYVQEQLALAMFENQTDNSNSHFDLSTCNSLESIKTDGYGLCGSFHDDNGNEAFQIMNYSRPAHENEATTTMTFNQCDKAIIIQDGEKKEVSLTDNVLSLSLHNGDGAFVIPYASKL